MHPLDHPPFAPAPSTGRAVTFSDVPDAALHRVLKCLPAADLARAAAVSRGWNAVSDDDALWRAQFSARWRAGDAATGARSWRAAYSARVAEAAALASPRRPAVDILTSAARSAARAVVLLPSVDAVVVGAGRSVRAFRLSDGAPTADAGRAPCPVRCVAAAPGALVVAGSGADARLAVWRADGDGFGLDAAPALVAGHTGPVAAVAVDDDGGAFYSASWDGSVRVWRGSDLAPLASHALTDWAWSVAPRGGRLLAAEGRGAAVLDAATGAVLRRVPPPDDGVPPCGDSARVDGSRDGRTLFVAHARGGVDAVDLRAPPAAAAHTLLRAAGGGGGPAHLTYDDHWLALASGRAGVALIDARRPGAALSPRPPRRLGWAGAGGGARCADVAGRWVAAGWDDGGVRTWRFGG